MLEQHSFQEVMRQFDRMCKAHAGCVDCPLSIKGSVETKCSMGSFISDSEYVEREIMQWAAEHPEPVYPTWEEWLITQGVIKENPNGGIGNPMPKLFERIPDDIAQKLGIEPKEG